MMDLLYFSDISQLDHVLESDPGLLERMRPMTGDMTVSYELERLGIDFIDEWNYLQPEDIERNWNEAYRLSMNWWDGNPEDAEYEGLDLRDAASQDMVYSLEASLNARTAYGRIFDAFEVKRISGYFLPKVAVVRTGPAPTSRAVLSVTQAVLIYMAEGRGIPVEPLESTRPLSQGRLASKPREGKRTDDVIPVNREGIPILIYRDGFPDSEHAAILEILGGMPGMRPVSISSRELELGNEIIGPCGKRFSAFRKGFSALSPTCDGEYPEIFGNPHLLFQFDRICEEMEKAAALGDVFAAFLDELNPSLVLFGHEAFTVERVFVRLTRKRSIPTAAFLHGGAGFLFGFRGIVGESDHVLVWNQEEVEWLSSFGVEKGKIERMGTVRYLKAERIAMKKKDAKERLGMYPEKPLVVLVTATVNTGFAAPVVYPDKHRNTLREIGSLAEKRPDLQFAIKPHPSFDYYDLYRRLKTLAFVEAALEEVLDAADMCVMVNYCTTAALEAMLAHVPVVYLENAVYPLQAWQDNLTGKGLIRVRDIDQLERRMGELLSEEGARREALEDADREAARVLGAEGSPERLVAFAGKAASGGRHVIRENGKYGEYAGSYLAGFFGEARGSIFQAKVMGAINGGRGEGGFALFRLLFPCILHPFKFVLSPPVFRRAVVSRAARTMLGGGIAGLIRKARKNG